VFEAIKAVKGQYKIDPDGSPCATSMGGAGAWHLGLHHPDQWSVVEAGAGYTETKVYAKKGPLPPYQEAALHYYDAVDYALNIVNVPFVGYGGEIDAQLQASKNIQEQLLKEGLKLDALRTLFLVGPQTAHSWHPETHKISERFVEQAVAKGRVPPRNIRFVTYTTRFNRCFWIAIEELDRHYERAEVTADREGAKPSPPGTSRASRWMARARCRSTGGSFQPRCVREGQWQSEGRRRGAAKRHGLRGPVDDVKSFLCVRPPEAEPRPRNSGLPRWRPAA
jgi:hypothetical protein